MGAGARADGQGVRADVAAIFPPRRAGRAAFGLTRGLRLADGDAGQGGAGGRPIRGRSMVAGLVVELGRRKRAGKDADMERLRWSAPPGGGRGHSGCGRRLAVSQFYTAKQGEDRISARRGMRYGLGMLYLWLVVAGYFALVLGLLIAVGLAPEGHEDVRGFHFIKPQADDAGAGRSAAAGSKAGRENALATKGNE